MPREFLVVKKYAECSGCQAVMFGHLAGEPGLFCGHCADWQRTRVKPPEALERPPSWATSRMRYLGEEFNGKNG
jgi:hypothetical protein